MALQYLDLAHIAIRCKSFETMYDFYINKLGGREFFHLNHDCRPEGVGNEGVWLTYINFGGGQYVEMFSEGYDGTYSYGSTSFASFCIETGNIVLKLKSLDALGVEIFDAPNGNRVLPPYAEIQPDDCGALTVYVHDPDNNWIGIQQFKPDSLQMICQ